MKAIQIYDPAMCCSTGVCGPSVDSKLVKLAADVAYLKSQGVTVERYNLAHQPEAFTANPLVLAEMGAEAENLPLFIVEGQVMAKATYPSRSELAHWLNIEANAISEKSSIELPMASTKCCESEGERCC